MKSIRMPFLILSLLMAIPAFGATFIVPDDRVLIERADAVVQGYVLESWAEFNDGRVRTITRILVQEVLSGDVERGSILEVIEPGGSTPEGSLLLAGVPRFEPGERVLLLTRRNARGYWESLEFALGKFSRYSDVDGKEYLLRERGEICGWKPGFLPHREVARRAGPFIEYVKAVLRGESPRPDYAIDYEQTCALGTGGHGLTAGSEALADYLMCNCRWNNGASAAFLTNGTQSGIGDSLGSVDAGTGVWVADTESTVGYSRGGTTTITAFACDGEDVVVFNDPGGEISGSFTGSGTLAIGGPCFGGSHSFASATFSTISEGQVVVQDGVSNATGVSQGEFEAMMAHELGHTLGFRHPDEGGPPASDGSASTAQLMSSILNRSSATLSQWDIDAVRAIYGSGAVTCTAVSITGHPQSTSIVSGASANLSVSVGGTGPFTYQWYRGNSGDTSTPVGSNSSSFNTGALTSTTSYWVRVTNCTDKTANSNTATVTVTDCTPPTITTEPQDASITSGASTTLSIAATGTPTITYQWYRHIGGNTFQAVTNATTSTTFNTGTLSATQQYLCVVRNPCATGDDIRSRVVTVSVTASCTPPTITGQPSSKTILEGESTTLSVTATGTTLAYQWFEGSSGVTVKPVGTNSSSFATPLLTATTRYWVRVTNGCGAANSQTATIAVTPKCPQGKLCSLNRRFELDLAVRDHRTNRTGNGVPLQENDLFGFFSLPDFTGDANNPEVFVKMLDGRTITGDFWVFYGGLTDLEYTLTVSDTESGSQKTYFKTGGTSNGGFDVGLGVTPEACAGELPGTPAGTESPTVCQAREQSLCLNASRFRVEVLARDQRTGNTAPGVSIPKSDIFGYFALPGLTGNANNPEVFVKVIDGRVVNNFFWVFFSGLTDFEYTVTVVDTFTGQRKSYTKAAASACGFFDTKAF